jgi:hypothetical protein
MGGANSGEAGGGRTTGHGSLPEQVMNSALQYQVAKPIVDAIMKDAGLANPSLTGISESVAQMISPPLQAAVNANAADVAEIADK